MDKLNYPKFLSGKPTGKDELSGGSHNRTAEIIVDTIIAETIEKRVIGLEGEWGSGKSNVIEIVRDKLGEKYYTFIFDSWGNQEDLTRKSFLEQLISQLLENEFLTNEIEWSKLESQLLSRTSTVHKQKFPKVKSYWVLFTVSILFYAVLSSFYNNILSLNPDLIPSLDFGPLVKPFVAIYLIPSLTMLTAVGLSLQEFVRLKKQNSKKKVRDQETNWGIIGKIFYWFNGQEINTEEIESVLEKEPSFKNLESTLQV